MTKIVLTDGTEEFLSPGAAREKVAAGEATYPGVYKTRQMVADVEQRGKRKRRTKAEIEADKASADEAE